MSPPVPVRLVHGFFRRLAQSLPSYTYMTTLTQLCRHCLCVGPGVLPRADSTVVHCIRLIHVGLVLRCRRDQPVFLLGIQAVHLPDTRLLC